MLSYIIPTITRSIRRISSSVMSIPDNDVTEMIETSGYPVETHSVTTDDGYILQMHRIPHGRNNADDVYPKPAVYLQHGLLCSSADWVMAMPEKSLGYILADAGYDVWLGNYRGNTYSRRHVFMDPDSDIEFWNFSWEEMGTYDIPAMVGKVLEVSGQKRLFYIGHSMGTTGFLVMANKRPDLLDKIILASLLAPVAFVDHIKSPIRVFAPYAYSLQWLASTFGVGEFLPSNSVIDMIIKYTRSSSLTSSSPLSSSPPVSASSSPQSSSSPSPNLLQSIIFLLCGYDKEQMEPAVMEKVMKFTPAGTSAKTLLHYDQQIASKKFHAFDYTSDNMRIYGQSEPPEYRLDGVTTPVAVYYSNQDWLADPQDVMRLTHELPNLVRNFIVPFDLWNHLDYLWGKDASVILYPEVLKTMEDYKEDME